MPAGQGAGEGRHSARMGGSRPAPAPGPLSACEKEEGGLAEEETGTRRPWGGQQLALPLRMCLVAAGRRASPLGSPGHASWPSPLPSL